VRSGFRALEQGERIVPWLELGHSRRKQPDLGLNRRREAAVDGVRVLESSLGEEQRDLGGAEPAGIPTLT